MLDDHPGELKQAMDSLLNIISNDICAGCSAKGENPQPVDLSNPLESPCSCDKIKPLLETARSYMKYSYAN